MSKEISPSEAVYGFAAWLVSRSERVTFSSQDDMARPAELAERFCEYNALGDPRPGWEHRVLLPRGGKGEAPAIFEESEWLSHENT